MSRAPDVARISRWLKALADDTRVRIVALLSQGELCVCHLEAATGVSQSVTSRHLGILRAAAIVEARRQGQWVFYRLAPQEEPACAQLLASLVRQFRDDRELTKVVARATRAVGPTCAPKPARARVS